MAAKSNSYMARNNAKDKGVPGRKSETRTAKRMGGKQTPGSGSLEGAKGDFAVGAFLFEAKSTVVASMQLRLNWLAKIIGEAGRANKIPALTITFCTDNGTPKKDGAWVMIPESVFNRMLEADLFDAPGEEST